MQAIVEQKKSIEAQAADAVAKHKADLDTKIEESRQKIEALQAELEEQRTAAAKGDDVLLFGKDGDNILPVQEVADWMQTITYEVTCALSRRVPRIYL